MRIRYIPAFVALTAGAITCIISIINQFDLMYSLKVLLAVLIAFYVLGIIAQKIIIFTINNLGKKKETEEIQDGDENEVNEEPADNKETEEA